eukprot:3938858-Rhodomonas_salina.1
MASKSSILEHLKVKLAIVEELQPLGGTPICQGWAVTVHTAVTTACRLERLDALSLPATT